MSATDEPTAKRRKRSLMDLVYIILDKSRNPILKNSIYCLVTTGWKTFSDAFNLCLDNKLIEISRDKNNKKLYIITDKGRNFMIYYESMSNYINKMNNMLNGKV